MDRIFRLKRLSNPGRFCGRVIWSSRLRLGQILRFLAFNALQTGAIRR